MNNQWGPLFKELTRLFDDMRLCRVQNFISVHKSGKKNSISYTKSKLRRRFSNAKYQKKILV